MLAKAADLLVDGAVGLSRRFAIPELVVGLTLCAFGTSAPELFVNGSAALAGRNALVLGNVLGSNVFNTLLVLGIGSLIFPLRVRRSTLRWELPFGVLACLVFLILANDAWFGANASILSRWDGLFLLGCFGVFLAYIMLFTFEDLPSTGEEEGAVSATRCVVYVCLGLIGLPLAAQLVLAGALGMTISLGISEELVGLTLVSAGTSLPELAATAAAAWRKRADLAVGNVVGSNIFNLLLVLGASSLLSPVESVVELNTDGCIFVIACVAVVGFVAIQGLLSRGAGAILLTGFVAYLAFLSLRESGAAQSQLATGWAGSELHD
ncbi:MAG: calcium/sodium antiporter [Proteobacteria bacterium]|nr:calcium/sodium antiporter [Pseudomonadota bacterium]